MLPRPTTARRVAGWIVAYLAAASAAGPGRPAAAGQDTSFSVLRLSLHVFVNTDASVGMIYDITLRNDQSSRPVHMIRLRTPHRGFALRNVVAALDGQPARDIRLPLYGDPGVEIWLGKRAIRPGGKGTLHIELTLADVVLEDVASAERATIEVVAPSFDEQPLDDETKLLVSIHALPGTRVNELIASPADAETGMFAERASLTWRRSDYRLTEKEPFRATFPRRGMSRIVKVTWIGLMADWFGRSPIIRLLAGVLFFTLYGLTWQATVGGRHIAVFCVLAATLATLFLMSPAGHLLAFVPLAGLATWSRLRRRRAALRAPHGTCPTAPGRVP
jgi:hypothetical protein